MASDLSFVEYVCEQISAAGSIAFSKMFGEYAICCEGILVALVCDNRLFIKPTSAGRAFIGSVVEVPPYPGVKDHFLLREKLADREWLSSLVRLTEQELPAPETKKG